MAELLLAKFVNATYYIVLSALLGIVLLVVSPNFRQFAAVGLCFWLFVICLIVSGIVGIIGGIRLAAVAIPQNGNFYVVPPSLLAWPFAMAFVSIVTFFILYSGVAMSIVRLIEKRQKVEFGKPSFNISFALSALSPFILWPFVVHVLFPHG